MNESQAAQELSQLFSSSIDEEDFHALAERAWNRNKRFGSFISGSILLAAILGCSISWFVIGSSGFVPAVTARLDITLLPNGSHLLVAIGMVVTLLSSFWIAKLAAEQ